MFDLMPFERRTRNLSNLFDAMERSFFGDLSTGAAAEIRTDIRDTGDRYVLEEMRRSGADYVIDDIGCVRDIFEGGDTYGD